MISMIDRVDPLFALKQYIDGAREETPGNKYCQAIDQRKNTVISNGHSVVMANYCIADRWYIFSKVQIQTEDFAMAYIVAFSFGQ